MPTHIDAVIFDWGGTLTPWHVIDARNSWATVHSDDDVIDRLHAAESAVWIRSRDEHLSGTLAEILQAAQLDAHEEAIARYDSWWDEHTIIDPQAPSMLRSLRERGIKIGVLSNTIWSRRRHEAIFARDGVLDLIDGAVYTSEIPWTKPHPQAFRAAMDAVGVDEPTRTVFVGDRLFDDIHGAQNAGMRAIYVPHSAIPADQRGHTEGEPDATIQKLSDLVEVIDRWNH
ncbi:MAG: HAD-superfamily hydrolase, subfamily variant 3 [Pseudonocardiales bacterium]|nr:HAD-superfamily hydrolase, subfamily variant 3 [Pseudonocardiales bacterium]